MGMFSTPNWVNSIERSSPGTKLGSGSLLASGGLALGAVGMGLDAYMNYKNYQLQKEQYKYEKGLQQTIFQREDNATQRRVADLRAAGLSPVLAAGSPAGSGAVVSTEAPQIGRTNLAESVLAAMNVMKMKEDISRTRAEEQYINTQRVNAEKMLPYQIDASRANAIAARAGAFNATQEGRSRRVEANNRERTGLVGGNPSNLIRDTLSNYVASIENLYGNDRTGSNNSNDPILQNGRRVTRRISVNGRDVVQYLTVKGEWRNE